MKDFLCVLLMGFIMIYNLISIYEIKNKNNYQTLLTPINTSIIYGREELNKLVEARKVKIINSIVTSIVTGVMYEADHARTKFEWKDMEMIVDNSMYNTVINKLKDIFQNVTFEEYLDNELEDEGEEEKNEAYTIRLNWE